MQAGTESYKGGNCKVCYAGLLLLFMPEEHAFWGLHVLVDTVLAGYFDASMAGAVLDQEVCRALLHRHFPTAMQRAQALQVDLALVAAQWCASMR